MSIAFYESLAKQRDFQRNKACGVESIPRSRFHPLGGWGMFISTNYIDSNSFQTKKKRDKYLKKNAQFLQLYCLY